MAFSNGGGFNDGATPIAEINITPLTDVMLVLLIIAMVAAPTLVYQGRAAKLPKVEQTREFKENENLLEVDDQGQLYFNRELITEDALKLALADTVVAADASKEPATLLIAGSPDMSYQTILNLLNLATEAKVEDLVLVADVVDQTGASLLHRDGNVPPTTHPAEEVAAPVTEAADG